MEKSNTNPGEDGQGDQGEKARQKPMAGVLSEKS
jgi:hypothetical protein